MAPLRVEWLKRFSESALRESSLNIRVCSYSLGAFVEEPRFTATDVPSRETANFKPFLQRMRVSTGRSVVNLTTDLTSGRARANHRRARRPPMTIPHVPTKALLLTGA